MGPDWKRGLGGEGTSLQGVPNLSLSENWALGQSQPSGLPGLQPSDGSDCHFPTPSEGVGKLRSGWGAEKQSRVWEKGRRGDTGGRTQLGRWRPPPVPGPLVSPRSPVRIHYEKSEKVTTPSERASCVQAARGKAGRLLLHPF